MKRILAPVVLLTVLFLFASCGDTGLFLDDSGEEDFVIESIEEGSVLKSSDEIQVSLLYDEGVYNPESLEILLIGQDEEIIGSTLLKGSSLADPLPPVSLPELEPGYYVIRYIVRTGEEIITDVEFPFFFTDDDYLIQGISIYPPVILPEGSGLLEAELHIPAESDPFLRWSSEETLIYEGLLSEGADRIEWTAPDTAGVYVITFELFPFETHVPGSYSFNSTVSHQARIYVGDKQGAAKGDIGPEENYHSLFHFKGSLVDSGIGSDNTVLEEKGHPSLDMRDGFFGYYLDGVSGFSSDRLLIPPAVDGAVPFSVTFRFLLEEEQEGRDFFTVLREPEESVFRIFTDDEGSPALELVSDTGSALVSSGIAGDRLGMVRELTVSIVPLEYGTLIQWFVDGIFSGATEVPFIFSCDDISEYTSIIGGDSGFTGILDEFGVYSLSNGGEASADHQVFQRAMRASYGKTLLLAEGFDGFVDTGVFETGGAFSLSGGALVLEPGSSLRIPEGFMAREAVELVWEIETDDETEPVFFRDSEGALVFGFGSFPEQAVPCPLEEGTLACSLVREESTLLLTLGESTEPLRFPGDFDSLDIVIENASETTRVFLHSVLMYEAATQIAESETGSAPLKSL